MAGGRDATSATEVDGAAPLGQPAGGSVPEQPASSAARPAATTRVRSRSPQGPRVDHYARAQFRLLPGLFDQSGRVGPAVWRVDHIELDSDSVFHLRFSSRVADGDAAAGPARCRILVAAANRIGARLAVRLRPETAADRLR